MITFVVDTTVKNRQQRTLGLKMFKPMREIALLVTIHSILIQQLVWALTIDQDASSSRLENHVSPLQPSTKEVGSKADIRRPLWNIAHMVNSIKELDYRLGKGANAIEADVTFSQEGNPLFTYHGPPCDCWRHCHQQEDFQEYLRYVREIVIDEENNLAKNLTLVFLDLKLNDLDHKAKGRAGHELAKALVFNLFSDPIETHYDLIDNSTTFRNIKPEEAIGLTSKKIPNLRVVISVNHVTDIELINNFLHHMDQSNSSHLMNRIGFDVGMNDDLIQIEIMWRRFRNTLNIWQGDGFTNCISPFYNLGRLSKAILKRDQQNGYPKKVYQWTIDLHDRIRESLRLGVDGVITNHPERLIAILNEPEIAHDYRLATRDDNPFKKIIIKAQARSSESARYQRSTNVAGSGFFGGLFDIISSWFNYVREIPFLSLPTTSRFLPSVKRHKQATRNLASLKTAQPEVRASNETTAITITTTNSTDQRSSSSASNESEQEQQPQQQPQQPPYEGPKWYTSVASNLLVSALKIIMPENTEKAS